MTRIIASIVAAGTTVGMALGVPAAAMATPNTSEGASSEKTVNVGPGAGAADGDRTGLQLSDNYLDRGGAGTYGLDGANDEPSKTHQDKEFDYPGGTTSQYDYKDATRDYVYIDTGMDSDKDGQTDLVRADFIRPSDTQLNGRKIPAIMDASPYYGYLQAKQYEDMNDKANSRQTSFAGNYDNFFVPRGYAYIMLDITGTALSQGCTDIEGPNDVASAKAVVDWLNGRVKGYRSLTDRSRANEEKADWSNGLIGVEGGSYDGAAANALAVTGVEGLRTVIPEESISSQYNWYRNNGAQLNNWWEPDAFANSLVTDPAQNAKCAAAGHWSEMNKGADLSTRNYNDFWAARNYEDKVGNIKASVFLIQGVNDLNTKMNNVDKYWALLQKNHVPSKIWITQNGHDNPKYYRHDEWILTLHKWYDHWLYGIDNDIMNEPQASVESSDGTWKDYASWPTPDAKNVTLTVDSAKNGTNAGTLGTTANAAAGTEERFSGYRVDEGVEDETTDQLGQPLDGAQAIPQTNRLAYLTEPLQAPAHISGTPALSLKVKASDADANLSFALVDYGSGTRIKATPQLSTVEYDENHLLCLGGEGQYDDGCSPTGSERKVTSDAYVITRGYVNTAHKDSLTALTPTPVDEYYPISWDAYATDYTVPAGHRLGLVIFNTSTRLADTGRLSDFTVSTSDTKLTLPLSTAAKSSAPTGVAAQSKPVRGGGDVITSWKSPEGNDSLLAVDGYEIQAVPARTGTNVKTYSAKVSGANTTTAVLSGVPAGDYTVRVRALTGGSASDWSVAASVTVTAAPADKPAPGASGSGAVSGASRPVAGGHAASDRNPLSDTGSAILAVVIVAVVACAAGVTVMAVRRHRQ